MFDDMLQSSYDENIKICHEIMKIDGNTAEKKSCSPFQIAIPLRYLYVNDWWLSRPDRPFALLTVYLKPFHSYP